MATRTTHFLGFHFGSIFANHATKVLDIDDGADQQSADSSGSTENVHDDRSHDGRIEFEDQEEGVFVSMMLCLVSMECVQTRCMFCLRSAGEW
jgi:hypothetical protein